MIEHRRGVWNAQMELARLRAPEQVADRVDRLELPVGTEADMLLFHNDPQAPKTKKGR
jgi:hypothetical protein